MTREGLIAELMTAATLDRSEAEAIVTTIFDSITAALAHGDKVEIRGFGSFKIRSRKARTARNPKTGQPVHVPAKRVPFFTPSKELRHLLASDGVP